MGRIRGAAVLAGWVLALAGLLAALVMAGDGALAGPPIDPGSWGGWLAARTAPEAAMAVVRLVGAALAAYLLLTTTVAVALRVGRAGRLIGVADVFTLPVVQRLAQLGLGVGLAGATVAAAGAGSDVVRPPTAAEIALVSSGTPAPAPAVTDAPVLEPVDSAPPVLQRVAPAGHPTHHRRVWTVAPGDHLWSIAERVLADAWGRPPADAEIAPFWTAVVDGNRSRLADPANPDLLFPGQTIDVPAPPPSP